MSKRHPRSTHEGINGHKHVHPSSAHQGTHGAGGNGKFIKGAIKHPGLLTAEVGGKPSQNVGKVEQLAKGGNKAASFYLNVLSKVGRG